MSENKNKGGRPRKTMEALVRRGIVPEDWKEGLLQLGREGKYKLHFANYLNIRRDLMYRIMDRDPEFSDTIRQALQLSEMWWVNKVSDAFENDTSNRFNATLWKYYMSNIYRDSWKVDEQQIDITTAGQQINNLDNSIIVEIIQPKNLPEGDL